MYRRQFICFTLLLLTAVFSLPAQSAAQIPAPKTFSLKSAPHDLEVYLNDELIKPFSSGRGIRNYRLTDSGTLKFIASGHRPQIFNSDFLPVKNGIVGIKLENTNSVMQLKGEYKTGSQPKSVYFSPDGKRLFVPLINQHGVDVFYQKKGLLIYEKRLTVPDSKAIGFVEALCDAKRRELWVSNMLENKVHIYDLDTLEYKLSLNTGGVYPKVIAQSPDTQLTIASNWSSMDVSVFDSNTKKLLRRIPVGGTPRGMAFSPDSSLLYVAIYDEPLIVAVNLEQNKIVSRFRLYQGAGAARHVIYNDEKLYVSDMLRGTVNILNAQTGALLHSRRIGMNINTIVLSPCGHYIFASSRGTNHPEDYTLPGPDYGAVYMLDAKNLTLREKIWGRNQPTGLAVSPDGKYMVFTDFLDANLEWYSLF